MLLSELGELGLIERISARLSSGDASSRQRAIRGIGDDCAVLGMAGGMAQVVTTDALVEGVHFLRDSTSPEALGHKSLAVSLSDVAAMGAEPRAALVSIAAPEWCTVEYVESFYDGMAALASRFSVEIVGGDTCSSVGGLTIGVTLIGVAHQKSIRYRSGAFVGDALMVAGVLGDLFRDAI